MADKPKVDPTALEAGLAVIYGNFLKYAAHEQGGDPTTISKNELSKMFADQLPHIAGNDMAVKVMTELDKDQDGTMNFMEYCGLITTLSMLLHMVVSEKL